jgi:hypothetical protein
VFDLAGFEELVEREQLGPIGASRTGGDHLEN